MQDFVGAVPVFGVGLHHSIDPLGFLYWVHSLILFTGFHRTITIIRYKCPAAQTYTLYQKP